MKTFLLKVEVPEEVIWFLRTHSFGKENDYKHENYQIMLQLQKLGIGEVCYKKEAVRIEDGVEQPLTFPYIEPTGIGKVLIEGINNM